MYLQALSQPHPSGKRPVTASQGPPMPMLSLGSSAGKGTRLCTRAELLPCIPPPESGTWILSAARSPSHHHIKLQLLAPAPPYYPFPRGKPILGVIYGVLLWADMNAATPLGAWGSSAMSLAPHCPNVHQMCEAARVRGMPDQCVLIKSDFCALCFEATFAVGGQVPRMEYYGYLAQHLCPFQRP